MTKLLNFNNFTLLVALSLSIIAEFYAIIGLATIFAGAAISAMVMGTIFGIAKITTLVWLRKYWSIATTTLKIYLVTAVVILALLTSMGIFGYLSKAHSSSSLPGTEMQQQVELIDDKIQTERELINSAKDQLTQLDAQVNNFINKGTSEKSAERSVQIRRQQQAERKSLQKEIEESNKKIATLTEEKTPLVRELRNFEAEIGPIKYVAALIYGDNPDQNLLEKSVRWMIILIVLVFDPLAIAMVLAANHSKAHEGEVEKEKQKDSEPPIQPVVPEIDLNDVNHQLKEAEEVKDTEPILPEVAKEDEIDIDQVNRDLSEASEKEGKFYVIEPEVEVQPEPKTFSEQHYKTDKFELVSYVITTKNLSVTEPEPIIEPIAEIISESEPVIDPSAEAITEPVTETGSAKTKMYTDLGGEYVHFEGKRMHKRVLQSMHPELFIKEDISDITVGFGKQLPKRGKQGSMFIRVDVSPHRVFKYSGSKWFEIDKSSTDSYLSNDYVKLLIDGIQSGEQDVEQLTDSEREHIRDFLLSNLPNNVDKSSES